MVTGTYQPAFVRSVLDLHSYSRPGRVPAPFFFLGRGIAVPWLGAAASVAAALAHPYRAGRLGRPFGDVRLVIRSQVVSYQKKDTACFLIHYLTGVSAGVRSVVPD